MVDTYRRYKSLGVTSSDTALLGTTIASSMVSFPYTYIHANLSGDRGITAGKLVEVVSSFGGAQGVTQLNLSDNPIIGPASLALLSPVFAAEALRWLDVSKNKIGVDGATALVSVLSRSNVRTLVFGPKATRLHLQVADVAALAPQPEPEGLATAPPCVNDDFAAQELGPAELIVIAWWLSTEATAGVEAMDLSNNPFDPGDLEAPANMKINVDGCAIPESDSDDYCESDSDDY